MENIKLLFVHEDDVNVEEIKELFKTGPFNLVAATSDGIRGIELIDKLKPDVVITGMVVTGSDGFGVIKKAASLKDKCKVIVLSAIKNERIIQSAMDYGALYYMITPIQGDVIKERLTELCEKREETSLSITKKPAFSLDEKISKIFLSVGIPPHIKGYAYLREGVKMAVENPRIINYITKKLYPMIGEIYDTSASKVERAIRHAIEVAWNRNRIETINSVFGVRAYVGSEKPTNGEFIALVADKMLLEGF